MKLRSLALGSIGLALFSVALVGAGCVDTENERTLELAVGTRCTLNSDCTDPNVCVFGVCHAQCNTSADCDHGERCVKGDSSGNVCQLTSESTCAASIDCVGAQVCGVDGKCRDGCKANADCLTAQVCAQGTCADAAEVDQTTGKLPADPEHTGEGQPCVYNTDCPDPLTCVENTCAFQCIGDKDCGPGTTCVENRCTIPVVETPECVHNADCGLGFLCTNQKCVAGCASDAGCALGTRCFDGLCEKPVFDAAGTPDALAVSGSNLLTIYSGKVLRCPTAGCNPTNVEELFIAPDPYSNQGTIITELVPPKPLGGASTHHAGRAHAPKVGGLGSPSGPLKAQLFDGTDYDLHSDGDITVVVIPADFNSDFIWGCMDAKCDQLARAIESGRSGVSAMRADNGHAVLYRALFTEGYEVHRCSLDAASTSCPSDFTFFPSAPAPNATMTAIAVKKGLTPDDDVIYMGWSTGDVESLSVADCLNENCSTFHVFTAVDGIGQPTEVGNLRFDGDDLYWLTAEQSGNGTSFKAQTCSTAATCTASTFFSGTTFVFPEMSIGNASMFINDDGNIWRKQLP
ncbi:MAG: hypothetical protein U0414_00215 [Polyangiaceae bacterium]